MFAWIISLLMLVSSNGRPTVVPSGLGSAGNRNVTPADNPQPNPADPPDSDGTGSGGGGHKPPH